MFNNELDFKGKCIMGEELYPYFLNDLNKKSNKKRILNNTNSLIIMSDSDSRFHKKIDYKRLKSIENYLNLNKHK